MVEWEGQEIGIKEVKFEEEGEECRVNYRME
jgi:hypothetical protein